MTHDLDGVFKALADRHRRVILEALRKGPLPASELGRIAGLARNAVSFHLRWLKSAGLVFVERRGRWRWYGVQADAVAAWLSSIQALFAGAAVRSESAGGRAGQAGRRTRPGQVKAAMDSRKGLKAVAGRRRATAARASQRQGENVATDTLPDELL